MRRKIMSEDKTRFDSRAAASWRTGGRGKIIQDKYSDRAGSGRIIKKSETREVVRFVPLGGLEEVGRNMMFFEYKDEIVIIDAGLQFGEEETPGIDYIIPNTTYLEENRDRVKALIITHAHLAHIGAIPHIMDKIGNPPIYATALSRAIIKRRQEEHQNGPRLNFILIKSGETHKISENFTVDFFGGSHTIPDAVGVLLKTPVGNFCNLGDFRVDYDIKGRARGIEKFKEVAERGVQALFMDSTGAEKPGRSISEEKVEETIESLFKEAGGRIIVGTFASLLDRIYAVMKIAERTGRKVVISGRSMIENVKIAQNLGYIKVKPELIVPIEEVNKYEDS